MNINSIMSQFPAGTEINDIEINDYSSKDGHEVTLIYYYPLIKLVSIHLMCNRVYKASRHSKMKHMHLIASLFHLKVQETDLIEEQN